MIIHLRQRVKTFIEWLIRSTAAAADFWLIGHRSHQASSSERKCDASVGRNETMTSRVETIKNTLIVR